MEIELPAEVRLNEDHVAHIVPRVAGIVREVHKSIGDTVLEGELMAVLDSRELADAQAEYLAANSRLELARKEFAREKALWEEQISAEKDYLAASRELQEAQIAARAVQKLQALGLSEAQLREVVSGRRDFLTRYEMTSPFNGEVLEKHMVLGEALESRPMPSSSPTSIRCGWTSGLREGPAAHPAGANGPDLGSGRLCGGRGRHHVRGAVVDRNPHALARIVLPNTDRRWRPGLFLRVRLRLNRPKRRPDSQNRGAAF